jgi:hypothetical protein
MVFLSWFLMKVEVTFYPLYKLAYPTIRLLFVFHLCLICVFLTQIQHRYNTDNTQIPIKSHISIPLKYCFELSEAFFLMELRFISFLLRA